MAHMSIAEIRADKSLTNADRAPLIAAIHSGGSAEEAMYGAAVAQVYATLAVADAITRMSETNGPGYTLSQAIIAAGGMQP